YRQYERERFKGYKPVEKIISKQSYQTHCVIGNEAYSMDDDKKTGMILLNNLLGGMGMNSRLNLAIREKYGFCYNIESNYTPFTDTGIIAIYLGTDNEYIEKSIHLVYKELAKLRDMKLGQQQLRKAKLQIIGQLAILQEVNVNEMLSIGKSYLYYNRVDTIEEIYKKIETITSEDLYEIANEVFNPNKMSMLIFKSIEK
ncbi:MAG: insulinase family protein, partial [Bacteroidota bacterium]|nr:insulinase family protein [Bacteroidota bacterium]